MNVKGILLVVALISVAGISHGAGKQCSGCGIDTNIWRVSGGGLWMKSKNEYGNFRVIVRNEGWEHTRSFIELQWLRSDDEKQQVLELLTVPVTEFNDENWRNVSDVQYRKDTFIITFINRGEGETVRTAILRPGLPGKYKIEFK